MEKLELKDYQHYAVSEILKRPKSALWVEMGLGKTIITLEALRRQLREIKKVLIVAPLRVAVHVWPEEIKKWENFSELTFTLIRGTPKKRVELLNNNSLIDVINVENIQWLLENKDFDYDTLVIDESSIFKSYSSKRFKTLKKFTPRIKRMIQLTGTPVSKGTDSANGLLDLWPQMFLLDKGEALEKNITRFRNKYFTSDYSGFNYSLCKGAKEVIFKKIEKFPIRLSAEQYLEIPEKTEKELVFDLPPKVEKEYRTLEKEFCLTINETDILAPQAATLSTKLKQLSNGALYDEDKNFHVLHDEKLNILESVLNENETVLCGYQFESDWKRIKKKFPFAVNIKEEGAYENWNKKKIKLLCCHPKSAGHGLNLQKGGNVIVWFGLPWSLEEYQQFNARLFRTGQTKKVFVYNIISNTSIEKKVSHVLRNKLDLQAQLLNYFRKEK